jgi:hypothetical protein
VNFGQKIESHQDLPQSQIIEAAVAGFESAMADGYMLTPEEASRGSGVVLGEAKDMTARLAEAHARVQAPEYQPTEVQVWTTISLPQATHDLLGVTDLRDDRERVTDIKTASKKKPQSEADTSLQLTVYAAAFVVDKGHPPKELRLDTLTKTKMIGRQVLTTQRTERDIVALANRVNAMLASIKTGVFTPCDPGYWGCSPKWCGYFLTKCPYVNSERIDAANRLTKESNNGD